MNDAPPAPPPSASPLLTEPALPRKPLLQRSLVLVGLMGAGKTVLGRRLSAWLAMPFVDADAAVEEAAGCTIAEIFAREGEPAFRRAERNIIGRLLEGPPCVLATGGGAFMNDETRALVRQQGISLWLRAELDVLVNRTAGRTHRPLLNQGDPRAILADLMEKRYPLYAEANVVVDVSDESPDVTCQAAVAALERFLSVDLPNQAPPLPPVVVT